MPCCSASPRPSRPPWDAWRWIRSWPAQLERLAPDFRYDEVPHLEEHCLEVQLPFLQVVHPQARILPLLLGRPSRKRVERLAEALLELTRERLGSTLFVASSNMSSFLRNTASEAEAESTWIGSPPWTGSPWRRGPGENGSALVGEAVLLLYSSCTGESAATPWCSRGRAL